MKLLFFNNFQLGALKQGNVIDVSGVVADIRHTEPQQLITGLISNFSDYRQKLEEVIGASIGVSLDSVKVLPPLPKPTNIDCMAVNYMEDGTREEPAEINAFQKSPFSIIGPGDTMILPDAPATVFEGEAELAVVIGKRATNVSAANAFDYIFGYTNFIDGSARGLSGANVFHAMKSRDTFAPVGPYIVTSDEVDNPQSLQIQLWNNGVLKQNFNTNDMAHDIARCIEYITSIHTLEPGDILATGTNHRGLNPFQDGDVVELEIEKLGRLKFRVKDDLKRTWPRETHLEREEKGLPGSAQQESGKYT
ncbi:MAG: fumarylacetoacetate hydrolase family protein [Dehalococcoidia bacterium]|jgi:2-keto-4-pentenoate hydratase/2-oxohepta-3-ene-1,7-dioic acid hydratase in catechol pathway|nr:fumarylacetoacetate hydrolase family protein [Dehalococcoidia bacterium]|tara:strand:+ start:414 stop:1334 length:921 start_codon:yes stop_codon:yes gene_type:complete